MIILPDLKLTNTNSRHNIKEYRINYDNSFYILKNNIQEYYKSYNADSNYNFITNYFETLDYYQQFYLINDTFHIPDVLVKELNRIRTGYLSQSDIIESNYIKLSPILNYDPKYFHITNTENIVNYFKLLLSYLENYEDILPEKLNYFVENNIILIRNVNYRTNLNRNYFNLNSQYYHDNSEMLQYYFIDDNLNIDSQKIRNLKIDRFIN